MFLSGEANYNTSIKLNITEEQTTDTCNNSYESSNIMWKKLVSKVYNGKFHLHEILKKIKL